MAVINYYVHYTIADKMTTKVQVSVNNQPVDAGDAVLSLSAEEASIDADDIMANKKYDGVSALEEMTQPEKDTKAHPETLLTEQIWVADELSSCDIMRAYFVSGDVGRQINTQANWDIYTIALRDYITSAGVISASRPVAPV